MGRKRKGGTIHHQSYMLTLKDKENIYDLLVLNFPKEKKIPLSKLALYLKDKGFSYEEHGYKKLRPLLEDLNFLSLENSAPGSSDVFVTLHDFTWKEDSSSAEEEMPTLRLKPVKGYEERKDSFAPKKKNVPANKPALKEEKKIMEKKDFSSDEKKKILSLLSSYEKGKTYPLSQVSKTLSDAHVDYKALGFGKMKTLLRQFPEELLLKDEKDNKGLCFVTFLKEKKPVATKGNPKEKEKTVSNKEVLKAKKKDVSKNSKAKEGKKAYPSEKKSLPIYPEPKENAFYIPDKLLLSLREYTSLPIDDAGLRKQIESDYRSAYEKRDLFVKDSGTCFPVSFKTKDGEDVIASLKRSDSSTPYLYYLNFIGADKEKAKDVLSHHVYFPDFEASIVSLASLARKEPWCYNHSSDPYIILKIYLQYTYSRLQYQKKILFDEKTGYAVFNTGLKSATYEDIYGILLKNTDSKIEQEYIFQGFALAGSQGLGKVLVENFAKLPEKATYIESISDLYFDPKADIHTDSNHIILDNLSRFPLSLLKVLLAPYPTCKALLTKLSKEKEEKSKENTYNSLRQKVSENPMVFSILKFSLDQAISKAKRMVDYDYRNALPSFFPTRNVMSMMLPLCFLEDGKADAVLLIEKTQSGNYQGQTMLTLKQCYVNARLIGPLENTYLDATKIED